MTPNELSELIGKVAPLMDNATLGTLLKTFDNELVGRLLRSVAVPVESDPLEVKTEIVPDNPAAVGCLLDQVYNLFDNGYSRRSLRACSRETGLTVSGVRQLVEDKSDFEIITADSGTEYLRLKAIR